MSIEKVEVESNKTHACTGYVMSCDDTGRSVASFWNDSDAEDVAMKINNHDKMADRIAELENLIVENYSLIRSAYKQGDGGYDLFQESQKLKLKQDKK